MPSLCFDHTVPKSLVHKWSIDQVLLTDFQPTSSTEMLLAAQLPRAHSLYCETLTIKRNPDFAGILEACRQSCFVIAHEQFGVPLTGKSYQFLLQEMDARLYAPPYAGDQAMEVIRPLDVYIQSSISRQWKRGAETSGLVWLFTVKNKNDDLLANATIRQTWIEREKWREMRRVMRRDRSLSPEPVLGISEASGVLPEMVGRSSPHNVAIDEISRTAAGYSAVARVDIRHPVFFDHPIDHVYAMVQTEACRQLALYVVAQEAARAPGQLEIAGYSARFVSIAEFDLPLKLDACLRTRGASEDYEVVIRLSQSGRTVSELTLQIHHAFAN